MARNSVALFVEDPVWREAGIDVARLRTAARLALARGAAQQDVANRLDLPPPCGEVEICERERSKFGVGVTSAMQHPHPKNAPRFSTSPQGRGQALLRSELTILLTNDTRIRDLNARFRGKDKPTNVLSFPARPGSAYLGDVAIAFGVTSREAATFGVPLIAHTLHLVVHGVLHLMGYDHVLAREARTMERLEIAILAELGIPSPYAHAKPARKARRANP